MIYNFFCIPQLYLWGSPFRVHILGKIFVYVTIFNPTIIQHIPPSWMNMIYNKTVMLPMQGKNVADQMLSVDLWSVLKT